MFINIAPMGIPFPCLAKRPRNGAIDLYRERWREDSALGKYLRSKSKGYEFESSSIQFFLLHLSLQGHIYCSML